MVVDFTAVISPFQFGRELVGPDLVDRVDELDEVIQTIRGRERLFLIGPRRFGKTSLLASAAARVEELGGAVIRVNAEQFVGPHALAGELIRQAGQKLIGGPERGLRKLGQVFGSLQPQIAYDPRTDGLTVRIAATEGAEPTRYLTEVLTAIDGLAAKAKEPVAVIIDEFQHTVAEEGVDGERRLRAVVQTHRHVGYVFAGSDTAMLTAMTSEHGRPFYRLGSRMYLGPIPRVHFREHIVDGFARSGRTISETAVEQVLDVAEDVPYTVQLLANATWRLATGLKIKRVDETHVTTALERLLAREDPQYATLADQLTLNQRKALHAAAHAEGGHGLTSAEVARQYRMAVSTLRRAVDGLIQRGILRRVQGSGEGGGSLVFEDPVFRRWVVGRLRW